MTTARDIIRDCLTFGLNRLSPGEAEDADTFNTCLSALNSLADEMNGGKSFLFREILTASSAISTANPALGTAWTGLVAGAEILGASVATSSTDVPLWPMTMAQYQAIPVKTQTGVPTYYTHDGQATVYLYPVPTSSVVTLRTKQVVSDFADLSTDYTMPKGYRSALAAMLAKMIAPALVGQLSREVVAADRAARARLAGQAMNPAVLGVHGLGYNILTG